MLEQNGFDVLKRHSERNQTYQTNILCTRFSRFGVLAQRSECSAPRPSNRGELHHQRRPLRVLWCVKSKHVDEKTIFLGMFFKMYIFLGIHLHIYLFNYSCMYVFIDIDLYICHRQIHFHICAGVFSRRETSFTKGSIDR